MGATVHQRLFDEIAQGYGLSLGRMITRLKFNPMLPVCCTARSESMRFNFRVFNTKATNIKSFIFSIFIPIIHVAWIMGAPEEWHCLYLIFITSCYKSYIMASVIKKPSIWKRIPARHSRAVTNLL
jgi:hypothetical protein